jgi:hypothetical protein
LVGWEIKIVSEELLKKEIAQQMGKMMASGEAVPITVLEGVTTSQAETLAEKGIADVEALAATSVDDLVNYLDISMDQAEAIRSAANIIVEARNAEIGVDEGEKPSVAAEIPDSPADSPAGDEAAVRDEPVGEIVESEAAAESEVAGTAAPEPAVESVETQDVVSVEPDDPGTDGADLKKPKKKNKS